MANETVVIDVVANFKNQTGPGMRAAQETIDKFGESVKKTQNQVKQLTSEKWAVRLDTVDKATATISKVISKASELSGKTFRFGLRVIDYATAPLRKVLNFVTSIKGVITGIIAGQAVSQVVNAPISLADAYTSAYTGFETLFQDQVKAQKMMDDLDAFAKATPFKTSDVIANAQKMIGMGWSADNIIEDMRVIGDAAAATGKGADGLNGIILALSQIKTKGKLSTEELMFDDLVPAAIKANKAA